MATPEWLALKSQIDRAIDAYIADQQTRFGEVDFIPVNAILDRIDVQRKERKKARTIISLVLKERGWKKDRSEESHVRAKGWERREVEA